MKKVFLITLTIFALLGFSSLNVRANATTGDSNAYQCIDNTINTGVEYQNWYNGHCITPTPSLTPTPTITPVSPTPTQTPSSSNNNNGGGGGGGNPSAPSCSDQKPNGGPYNLQVKYGPAGQATLTWEPSLGPVSGYNIAYSTDPGTKMFGVPNTGNVTSFTVSGLSGTNYYWWVTPINGCMPGDPVQPGGPAVLGLSTTSSNTNVVLMEFAQLFGALVLSVLGYKFLKKNA